MSFEHQEVDDDFSSELMLKRPDRSMSLYKKNVQKKKQAKEKKLCKTKKEVDAVDAGTSSITMSQFNRGEIPSAAAIHAARKKREMARNVIGVTGKQDMIRSGPTNVVSDTENSDDESQTVRKFGISCDASKQMEVLSAMDAAVSGSDEEKFIEEQICKGVFTLPIPSSNSSTSKCQKMSRDISKVLSTTLPIASVPITVESLQSQLNSQLILLKEQQSRNKNVIRKLMDDIDTASKEITMMEKNLPTLSLKYQFFQEIRSYVKDLLLCLTQKVK